jgi:repressor LexA
MAIVSGMDGDAQRAALCAIAGEQGASLATLSRALGRNPAYLQQYVARGTPRLLAEQDRRTLAQFLGVAESRLGGPEAGGGVPIPRLDIAASAGPGRLVDRELRRRPAHFAPEQLRALGVRADAASILRVEGDSMEPLLSDGDEILVDRDRRDVDRQGGVYVIRLDGALMVKRLRATVPGIEVSSDNPAYPPIGLRRGPALEILGRVVWLSRAI